MSQQRGPGVQGCVHRREPRHERRGCRRDRRGRREGFRICAEHEGSGCVSERIGVAVLGTDHWYNLLPLLDQLRDSDTYELLSIADPLEQRGRGLAERYGATWFDSAGAALDVEGVVLAAVFSSTDRTSALVDEAAAHGKHIVCNKPVGMTIEAADRSVRAVDAAG